MEKLRKTVPRLIVVVPAAGVGKRMQANCPKQYLKIGELTLLEHTVLRLVSHHLIEHVIIALGADDEYFNDTQLIHHEKVSTVIGGAERVDSVLSGLKAINTAHHPWVLVHDAARPYVTHHDIDSLIHSCLTTGVGGILATPVRDTMKRSQGKYIDKTVEREQLWHALTPQMFLTTQLFNAIEQAQQENAVITDESSAVEFTGEQSLIVEGSSENIKITRPDDLAYAEFILQKQKLININNNYK